MRLSRGQQGKCARLMLLSQQFNKRLSPMNSRPSFATANAFEANLGSREEDGNMQASLQRSTLRTQARHCCWVAAKNEESSPSALHMLEANRVTVQLQHERRN